MSSYESQDVDMDAGTSPDSLSLSTSAVQNQTGTQEFDIFSVASGSEESIDKFSC